MSNSIAAEMLDEIERRCAAATPGPWKSFVEGRDHDSGDSFIRTGGDDMYLVGATRADQDFIASTRQECQPSFRRSEPYVRYFLAAKTQTDPLPDN